VIHIMKLGSIRNNVLETLRAFEVLKRVIYTRGESDTINFRYGEIPVEDVRIDGIVTYPNYTLGIEVTPSFHRVKELSVKLRRLRQIGAINEGIIMVLSLDDLRAEVLNYSIKKIEGDIYVIS